MSRRFVNGGAGCETFGDDNVVGRFSNQKPTSLDRAAAQITLRAIGRYPLQGMNRAIPVAQRDQQVCTVSANTMRLDAFRQ